MKQILILLFIGFCFSCTPVTPSEDCNLIITTDTIVNDFRICSNPKDQVKAKWAAACYEDDNLDPFTVTANYKMTLKEFSEKVSLYCKHAVIAY